MEQDHPNIDDDSIANDRTDSISVIPKHVTMLELAQTRIEWLEETLASHKEENGRLRDLVKELIQKNLEASERISSLQDELTSRLRNEERTLTELCIDQLDTSHFVTHELSANYE